jgi:hypothetical protein
MDVSHPIVHPDRTPPSRPKSIGDQPGDLGHIGEAIGFSGVSEGAIGLSILEISGFNYQYLISYFDLRNFFDNFHRILIFHIITEII